MWFLKCLIVTGGICYISLVAWAQSHCSIFPSFGHQCRGGGELDIWMVPFFFAILGVPLVIASLVIVGREILRAKQRK
jgi:hypothetical protein